MKKTVFILAMIIMITGVTFQVNAQRGNNPETITKRHTEFMVKQLDLNKEQAEKVSAINLDYAKKMREIRLAEDYNWEKMQTEFDKLRDEKHNKIKSILNAEQAKKIDEFQANHPGMRGPHGRMGTRLSPNMGACDPALIEKRKEFDSELNSEEKAIITEYRAKLPEIREQMREKIQKQRAECDGKPIGRMRSEMQNEFAPIVNIAEKHNERLEVIAKDHFANRNQVGMNGENGRRPGQRGFGKGQCDGTGQGRGYNGTGQGRGYNGTEQGKGYGRAGQGYGYGRDNTNGKQGRGMNANERGYMFAIHFLLMDTEQNLTTGQAIGRKFEVMPNPAKNKNTINYEVLSSGKVKIEILDKDGFIVKTVLDATKEKGVYSLNINISDLEQNLYFYRIMDSSGTDSIKFIVAR